MSDDATKFELHKSKLVAGLASVADSMRKCADMAEVFATLVNGGAVSADSPAACMIRDFVIATKTDPVPDEKASGKRKRKADVTEDGEAPKRRKRKPKDPNAPKRPASSYIIFQNEVRKDLKTSHPSLSNNELLNMIAKQWQEMSEEDKAVYHQAMATAKERYSQDKKAYDSRTAEEVEAANAAVAAAAANKKGRKPTKVTEAPAPARAKAPAPAPVRKSANTVPSPSSDASDGSASEESDEEVHEDRDEEHDSPSSEEEARLVAVTAVTPVLMEKRKKVKA